MNDTFIVSKINEYLYIATQKLSAWLGQMLPRVTDNWWNECVLGNMSYSQRELAEKNGYDKLEHLDLAALLRVTDKTWYAMRNFAYLPTSERECVRSMMKVRNNWAHCTVEIPDKDVVIHDINIIQQFLSQLNAPLSLLDEIDNFIKSVETSNFTEISNLILSICLNLLKSPQRLIISPFEAFYFLWYFRITFQMFLPFGFEK